MKILLDTHIFLWYISANKQLPDNILQEIRSVKNEVYLSIVSTWEIIIKYQLGKMPLPATPEIYLPIQRNRHQITNLDLEEATILKLATLPLIHKDPFDRMLICQALKNNLTIATVDKFIISYPVSTIS